LHFLERLLSIGRISFFEFAYMQGLTIDLQGVIKPRGSPDHGIGAAHVQNGLSAAHLDVLIVSEKPEHLRVLIHALDDQPARLSACFTIRQAQEILLRQTADLVLCDEYPPDGSYRDLLLSSRFVQKPASFVVLLHKGEWDEYLIAMRLGALDVLRSPLQRPEVELVIRRAFERKDKQIASPSTVELESRVEVTPEEVLLEELLQRAAAQSPKAASASASAPADGSAAARKGVA
jgi:DNA-binding NtrC family response regulator